jgi:hypothetical protein
MSSGRSLKRAWHGLMSGKVLLIVITGLPAWSSGAYLICLVRAMTEGAQIINAEPWMKP